MTKSLPTYRFAAMRLLFRSRLRLVLLGLTLVSSACALQPHDAYVELKGQRYSIEIANDAASRERGLMFRDQLAADHGMLFIFPQETIQTFWMKNTRIPLDIIYFDANRRLVNVQQRVPPCQADPCPVYPSNSGAMYTLELKAGSAEKLDLKPGDELEIHQ